MVPEEPSLFQPRFTEEGKKFIRKFAAISYFIIGLVFAQFVVIIYWDVKVILLGISSRAYGGYKVKAYDEIFPYLSMLISLLGIISNIYYTRFPRQLLRSIKINDEYGANRAFKILFNGAVIFLIYLFINSVTLAWSLITRPI